MPYANKIFQHLYLKINILYNINSNLNEHKNKDYISIYNYLISDLNSGKQLVILIKSLTSSVL